MSGVEDRVDKLPKYQELRRAIAAELTNLAPHDPLPSERELMARHGVSRMTVRQSLTRLVEDGLVYRVHGSGTFVADPATITKSLRLTSFSEDIRSRHMVPGAKLLLRERVAADAAVSQALSLEPGSEVEHLERLRTADGSPMCLENVWLPAEVIDGFGTTGVAESLYETLARHGHAPAYADQHIRATVLNPREAQLLGVPSFSPALVVSRVTYDATGQAIERAVGLYRADRYDFQVTVTRAGLRATP
jgi:GntR family transcriptional regulator